MMIFQILKIKPSQEVKMPPDPSHVNPPFTFEYYLLIHLFIYLMNRPQGDEQSGITVMRRMG